MTLTAESCAQSSSRRKYSVSIATAYRELEKDGLVVIKHGSGCEVAPRAATDRSHDELAQTLRTALTELVLAGLPTKRILKMVIRELQMVGKEGK